MSDQHRCKLPGCDGTRLGHELARDFPEQTRALDEAFDRMAMDPEDRVKPENLRVEEDAPTMDNDENPY